MTIRVCLAGVLWVAGAFAGSAQAQTPDPYSAPDPYRDQRALPDPNDPAAREALLRARGEAYHRADDSRQTEEELRTTRALNAEIAAQNSLADKADAAAQLDYEAAPGPSPDRGPPDRGTGAGRPQRRPARPRTSTTATTPPGANRSACASPASAKPARPDPPGSGRSRQDQPATRLMSRRAIMRSNSVQTPSAPCQFPCVAALEYSVARASKKLACSTPLRSDCSQGSGFSVTP
jgi:hypothetical protein